MVMRIQNPIDGRQFGETRRQRRFAHGSGKRQRGGAVAQRRIDKNMSPRHPQQQAGVAKPPYGVFLTAEVGFLPPLSNKTFITLAGRPRQSLRLALFPPAFKRPRIAQGDVRIGEAGRRMVASGRIIPAVALAHGFMHSPCQGRTTQRDSPPSLCRLGG